MKIFTLSSLAVFIGAICAAQEPQAVKIDVRVQIVRFTESHRIDRLTTSDGVTFCSPSSSEIEYRVIEPAKYRDISIVARIGGFKSGEPHTTPGNIWDATVDAELFDSKNITPDRKILAYTLKHPGLVNFRMVDDQKSEPNQRPEHNPGATSPSTSESTPGVAHP